MFSPGDKNRNSFTLIELLVVLALVAILSVVVVVTLNPAELLKQARDSNRLSDLSTINTALNLFSADVTSGFMGTSTVVYVSIPDNTSSTCGSLGLPTLPTGYTYSCVTTANLRNTNGTGWIPVNFQRISSNSPISQLPIDPTNTTSTRLYYTYAVGGSWELSASIEASKNKLGGSNDLVSKDGGSASSQYEIGNNLNLNPIETGDSSLVGYLNFEEGPNATSTDRSGYGNHGTWFGTSTAQQRYVGGKVGQYAGYFNGSSDYINFPNSASNAMTFSYWVNKEFSNYRRNTIKGGSASGQFINDFTGGETGVYFGGGTPVPGYNETSGAGISTGTWSHVLWTYDKTTLNIYVDGVNRRSIGVARATDFDSSVISLGKNYGIIAEIYQGLIDDVRVYNRALSVTEVTALYNSTK